MVIPLDTPQPSRGSGNVSTPSRSAFSGLWRTEGDRRGPVRWRWPGTRPWHTAVSDMLPQATWDAPALQPVWPRLRDHTSWGSSLRCLALMMPSPSSPPVCSQTELPGPLAGEKEGTPVAEPPDGKRGRGPAGTHMMLALCTAVTLLRWLLRAYSKANSAMRLLASSVMSLMLCTTPSTI